MLSAVDAAAVTDEVSLTAVPANTAKPSVPSPIEYPKTGNISAARILKKKITEIDLATSESSASITGAVAAMAEPPQIDEPTPIRQAVFELILRIFIIKKATISDVETVQIITGKLFAPTTAMVLRSSEKPRIITAHCNIFLDVNLIPPANVDYFARVGEISEIIIPVIIANTGTPISSNENPPMPNIHIISAKAAIIAQSNIPPQFFLINVINFPPNLYYLLIVTQVSNKI